MMYASELTRTTGSVPLAGEYVHTCIRYATLQHCCGVVMYYAVVLLTPTEGGACSVVCCCAYVRKGTLRMSVGHIRLCAPPYVASVQYISREAPDPTADVPCALAIRTLRR